MKQAEISALSGRSALHYAPTMSRAKGRSFKPYPAYKDSGVEWLGQIPAHWEVKKGKYLGDLLGSHNLEDFEQDEEGSILYVKVDDLNRNSEELFLNDSLERVKVSPATLRMPHSDLILFPKRGAAIFTNKVRIMRGPVLFDSNIMGWNIFTNTNTRYVAYALLSRGLTDLADVSSVPQINNKHIYPEPFPFPPESEQQAIVDYIDHETAKIAILIAKKERLLELLAEKRTALISHAVTKGLDPNVPMKDSGIEWLGRIPAHWEVQSVRNLIRTRSLEIQDGNHGELHPVAADYVSDGIPFLMATDIRNQKINFESCKFISQEHADNLRIGFAKPGDVLLTHKATLGETAIVPESIPYPYLMLTPQVTYYRSRTPKLKASYLCYFFQTAAFKKKMVLISLMQSTRGYVGITAQREFFLLLPPSSEQGSLVTFLDREIAKISVLMAKVREAIERLKEYRTSLISAAVTGKIDVRERG